MKLKNTKLLASFGWSLSSLGLAVAACNPTVFSNGPVEVPPCPNNAPPAGWIHYSNQTWTCCDETNLCENLSPKRKVREGNIWMSPSGDLEFCWVYVTSWYHPTQPCCPVVD